MKPLYIGAAIVGISVVGCSESSTSTLGTGGSDAAGGARSVGGAASTGGVRATGGTTTTSTGTGGATFATGGNNAGGTSAASGGTLAAGGSNTGGQAAGGKSAAGGSNTGGKATGGAGGQATGGKSAAGGSDTGGQAIGGKSAAGGSDTGGQATGGKSAAGGASIGGQATGGGSNVGGQATGGGSNTGGAGKSAGCGKAPTIASSQYNNGQTISITAAGKQRRYILNVPTNYDNTHPYRLVVAYHQLDGNDKQLYSWQYYGLLPLSNNSTIFVAPNGQKSGTPCSGTGNGDSGCGWPNSSDSDLALADAVVAQIEENFCVDTDRIFATGWSYGGSMSYRTGCSRPLGGTGSTWGVRGIAIYSAAQLSGNCTPSKPVAFYAEHGTKDSVLNYDSMGIPLAQNFAKANGCTWATPTKVTSGTHVCTNMTGCTAGYPLEFCSFNGDHTPYPDNGQAAGSWGPQEAWKFISQF